jgi:hypothetical protein
MARYMSQFLKGVSSLRFVMAHMQNLAAKTGDEE